jgi:hypothetical protein
LFCWQSSHQISDTKYSVALVHERTIPTELPPFFGEVSANFYGVLRGQRNRSLRPYSRFLDRNRYYFFQVAPQLYSRGWVDPVPDPLLLRKSGSAGNSTRTSGSVAGNSQRRPISNTCVLLSIQFANYDMYLRCACLNPWADSRSGLNVGVHQVTAANSRSENKTGSWRKWEWYIKLKMKQNGGEKQITDEWMCPTGSLWRRQSQQSFNTLTPFYFPFSLTTCFGPYGPSSGEI